MFGLSLPSLIQFLSLRRTGHLIAVYRSLNTRTWFALYKDLTQFEAAPSLESVKALSTEWDRDLTFSGLAIVSKLANACQSLVDVGKARSSSQQNCTYRDKGGFCHNMFVVRANSKSAAHWILYDDIFFQSMAAREKL